MTPFSTLAFPVCFLLLLTLAACSSSKDNNAENTRVKKDEPRLAQRLGNFDKTKRSSFDNHRSATGVSGDYKTGMFRRKEYKGKKEFNSGKDGFKTKNFAQSDKKSKVADKSFSGANDVSSMADDKFKTSESRFSGQESSSADKRFRMEDDVFRTREDPVAHKAQSTNRRPFIEQTQNPGYTENEVKGLLNKN